MIKVPGHRVLVRADKVEEIDPVFAAAEKAGLAIYKGREMKLEQNAVDKGVVVAIGPTAWKDFGGEPWCKVGDYIAFAQHAGKTAEDPYTKEKFVLLNDEDVCLVFVKEDTNE